MSHRNPKEDSRRAPLLLVGLVSLTVAACNGSGTPSAMGSGGTMSGGTTSSGGTTGSGGTTSSGGTTDSGGTASSGGTTGSSGTASSGGTTGSGGTASSGGTTGSGGTTSSGGTTDSGGVAGSSSGGTTTGTGGSSSSGGTVGTGGATSTTSSGGGRSAGGATGTGGGTAQGGAVGTGGAVGAGGDSGSGGGTGTGGATGAGGSSAVCAPPSGSPTSTPIQINDNGGWNWHMDERGMVDAKNNKLIIGSVASGGSRNGYVEAVTYDIAAGTKKRDTLGTGLSNNVDDHNSASFLIRPDGKYVALWSSHRTDCYTRYNMFDGSAWTGEKRFDWGPLGCPWAGASTNMVTYANPWYIGSTIFVAFRSVDSSPAFLTSDDGQSYSYYGRLTSTKQVGYVAGYYKYWGNNKDRIDFCGTEAHPRDYDNNLWHGYIQDGKVYNSMGQVIDATLKDTNSSTSTAKDISDYTLVCKTGAAVGSVALIHLWNLDMVRYDDGTVVILGQGRAKGTCGTEEGYGKTNCDPDKRMAYFRFDGKSWKATYLVKAGPKLYSTEEDYIGGGCVHPDDPHTIFISSNFDPRDDNTKTSKRELYQGTTCDNGATWQWTPITKNSTVDNIRPIVPRWDAKHTALVWMKGTYSTAQSYQMQIVGLVSEHPAGQVSFK
jgi:hypothetical protein